MADLFAGSGAMGIEALSRGARAVVFVDRAAGALRTVRLNLAAAGLAPAPATIVRADVLRWLSREAAQTIRPPQRFDLALCDPPYAFVAWDELLGRLCAGVAVLESSRPLEVSERWKVVRCKRYGGTLVTVVRAAGTQPSDESHDNDGRDAAGIRTT